MYYYWAYSHLPIVEYMQVGIDSFAAFDDTGMSSAGYPADQLKVGVHSLGYIAEDNQEAIDDFYPGYAHTMTEIGKERGWPKVTRASFDTQRGLHGALL